MSWVTCDGNVTYGLEIQEIGSIGNNKSWGDMLS